MLNKQERIFVDSKYRNFKTRLLFLESIFSNILEQEQILASSISYKLNCSYETYLKELNKSSNILENKDPIKVLQKSNKEI